MKKRLIDLLLGVLYPVKCPVCGEVTGGEPDFCPECRDRLTLYSGDFTINGAESFTAAYDYDKAVEPAVIQLKRGVFGSAAGALAGGLSHRLIENGTAERVALIIPVPMYRADQRERGMNQSEAIARELGKRLDILVSADSVAKVRQTVQQKKLKQKQRELNVMGAFGVVRPEDIDGKSVLLVDDVCTTGSTLRELTTLLLNSGAAEVHCAACCKTPLNNS